MKTATLVCLWLLAITTPALAAPRVIPTPDPMRSGSGAAPRAVAAAARIRPDTGAWYGPTDPYGAFGFRVTRPARHLWNVRRFHIISSAPCPTGQSLGFNFQRNLVVGVNTGLKRPAFTAVWRGTGEAEDVEGEITYEVTVVGRFVSHMRATGTFEVEVVTTDVNWGRCTAEGTWHTTAR